MRLIDADELRDKLQAMAYDDWNQGITITFADACEEVIELVDDLQTIEPVQTIGSWIVENGEVVCSECGTPNRETNFCPVCGSCNGT